MAASTPAVSSKQLLVSLILNDILQASDDCWPSSRFKSQESTQMPEVEVGSLMECMWKRRGRDALSGQNRRMYWRMVLLSSIVGILCAMPLSLLADNGAYYLLTVYRLPCAKLSRSLAVQSHESMCTLPFTHSRQPAVVHLLAACWHTHASADVTVLCSAAPTSVTCRLPLLCSCYGRRRHKHMVPRGRVQRRVPPRSGDVARPPAAAATPPPSAPTATPASCCCAAAPPPPTAWAL